MKSFLITLVAFLTFVDFSYSQTNSDKIRDELAPILGQNNLGTDFWIAMPEIFYKNGVDEESFFLVISSLYDNQIELKSETKKINIKANITAGKDTVITLIGSKYAKYDYNTNDERIITRVLKSSAIHIISKLPISVQTYNSYLGLKNASIAIPTNTLGKEYISQTYFTSYYPKQNDKFPPCISVTAPYDETFVKLKLSTFNKELEIRFENGDSLMAGDSITIKINKGDVWNIFSSDTIGDLSGSMIESNKPVNVLYSQMAISQPVELRYADDVHSTLFSTKTWGKTYSIPTIRELNEFPTIRIFSIDDDTKIYRNGVYWTTVDNSTNNEIFESKIWIDKNRDDETGIVSPTIITSDKPISIMVFPDYKSVEDKVFSVSRNMNILTPLEQSINFAAFSLFSLDDKYYYVDDTNKKMETIKKLELYFDLDENHNIPSELEFAIIDTLNPELVWKSVKDYYGNGYFSIELNGKEIACKEIFLPDSCKYFIKSKKTKFSGFVYKLAYDHIGVTDGISSEDFFGFPIGTSMIDQTSKDTITPLVTLNEQNSGNKIHGIVNDNHEFTSKLAQLYMIEDYSHNFKYDLLTADDGLISDVNGNSFVVGKPVQLEFELTKINENEDAFATIYTSDRAGNDTLVFINEDKFTSLTPEQTLSEYMTVTPTEITVLPQALSDGFEELSIFNLSGTKLSGSQLHNTKNISLANLQSGTYIITLKSDKLILTRKINIVR